MKKNVFFAVPLMAVVLISACSDNGYDNNTPPSAQTYGISGKIDYAGKPISSAKVCLDINNNGLADDTVCIDTDSSGEYSFTSANNPAYYPLAASIKEANRGVNAKITVDKSDYDSILYAPKGKTDTISIATTLAKSLMDKDSSLTFDNAEKQADTIIKKADKIETVLTVYNKALNTAPNSIDISTSIRGLVSVITDKLSEEPEITDSTAVSVTEAEVNAANEEIKKSDEEQPQEPVTPDDSTKTPLEKVTEMLAGAEIKNSAESPVNLNEYFDSYLRDYSDNSSMISIKPDAFGEYAGFHSEWTMTRGHFIKYVNYSETGWPSDSKLGFEVYPRDNEEPGYYFANTFEDNPLSDNVCDVGQTNGIYYKTIYGTAVLENVRSLLQQCLKDSGVDLDGEELNQNDMNAVVKCYSNIYYQYKDSIKIEKWYWTIDTTQLDVCK
ncbi:MAG: carboxypeptidase-like regulatory domain-containing protein [Mucispirillum sp.]|nr:carboxypeptidase-like regulatory domain-containing protein [Mucispirillum sp.]